MSDYERGTPGPPTGRHRIPTPRRLPDLDEPSSSYPLVRVRGGFRVHYCNTASGYVDVPAGAELELLGYSPRTGLPIVAGHGLTGAIVDPDDLDLGIRPRS